VTGLAAQGKGKIVREGGERRVKVYSNREWGGDNFHRSTTLL